MKTVTQQTQHYTIYKTVTQQTQHYTIYKTVTQQTQQYTVYKIDQMEFEKNKNSFFFRRRQHTDKRA
jgi:hypothetical protein